MLLLVKPGDKLILDILIEYDNATEASIDSSVFSTLMVMVISMIFYIPKSHFFSDELITGQQFYLQN